MSHIDAVLDGHQLTNGTGSVIAYQIENENYDPSTAGKQYMQDLQNKARAEGITVPLTFNEIVIGSTLYITGSALWTPPARETPAAAEIRIV